MPNQRAPGQKLLNFPAKEEFVSQMDLGVKVSGLGDRSKFIRCAIIEKLQRLKIAVPAELSAAPSRAGKGGAQKDSGKTKIAGGALEHKLAKLHPFDAELSERSARAASTTGNKPARRPREPRRPSNPPTVPKPALAKHA